MAVDFEFSLESNVVFIIAYFYLVLVPSLLVPIFFEIRFTKSSQRDLEFSYVEFHDGCIVCELPL